MRFVVCWPYYSTRYQTVIRSLINVKSYTQNFIPNSTRQQQQRMQVRGSHCFSTWLRYLNQEEQHFVTLCLNEAFQQF